MKLIAPLLVFSLLCTSVIATAQPVLTADEEALVNKMKSQINAKHVRWVNSTAREASAKNLSTDDLMTRARSYGGGINLGNMEIDALVAMVMMLCADDQRKDLKSMMEQMKALNEQKAKMREAMNALKNSRSVKAVQLDSFNLLLSRATAFKNRQNPDSIKLVRVATARDASSKAYLDAMADKLKTDLDSMSEMGEMESLRLQMAMDRMSKMMSTLSNILKKISKTAEEITQNLK